MSPRRPKPRPSRRGFTLLELLTVIAIIAILAGLLFPVFNQVRESARKSSCMSNMHQIVQALKVYKDDWHAYPETLYGGQYSGAAGCTAYPAGLVRKGLFPEYVKSEDVFVCPDAAVKLSEAGRNKLIYATNRSQGAQTCWGTPEFSSYDFQYIPNAAGGAQELHYTKKWTAPGTLLSSESQRQLVWREPPDSTVVTWCGYHAGLTAVDKPAQGGMYLVAFLGGNVKAIPAQAMINSNPWTATSGPWLQKPSK